MQEFYDLDLTGFTLFESPRNIRFLLEQIIEGRNSYSEEGVWRECERDHIKDYSRARPLLYIRDQGLLLDARYEGAIHLERMANVNRARTMVSKVLAEKGTQVVRLEQDIPAAIYRQQRSIMSDGPEKCAGWGMLCARGNLAIKVRTQISAEVIMARPWTFASDDIIPEKQFQLSGNKSWASAAPWQGDMQVLEAVYTELSWQENLAIMLGAMRGNDFMHTAGWSHGDIKPGNIGILEGSSKPRGVLFDEECSLPIGHPHFGLYTSDYSEKRIWPVMGCTYGKDIFSWAFTLLKVLTKTPAQSSISRIILGSPRNWDNPESSMHNNIDRLLNDAGLSHLKDLLHAMIAQDPARRPRLHSVINNLEKHL